MSARQAAAFLGVSKAYVCRLFSKGTISAEKVDTDWIVEKKALQTYVDNKQGMPLYYRNTTDWSQADFYFLFRMLDKMVHDKKGRYDQELRSIKELQLNKESRAILAAMEVHRKYPNLGKLNKTARLVPPLVLVDYPSAGAFPQFERYGVVL